MKRLFLHSQPGDERVIISITAWRLKGYQFSHSPEMNGLFIHLQHEDVRVSHPVTACRSVVSFIKLKNNCKKKSSVAPGSRPDVNCIQSSLAPGLWPDENWVQSSAAPVLRPDVNWIQSSVAPGLWAIMWIKLCTPRVFWQPYAGLMF